MLFVTAYPEILKALEQVDIPRYGATRNYYTGAVSRLSPYISRGVITLPQVMAKIMENYSWEEASSFIYELAWREYFQRTWWNKGDKIFTDLRTLQGDVVHHDLILSIVTASTGVDAVDDQINALITLGYMHNHARMYTASVMCNLGKAHWKEASKWMYYHLLDGDIASNTLGWQWVAGSFADKKYYCNQENINTYSGRKQHNTFLDVTYDQLPLLPIPEPLRKKIKLSLQTILPVTKPMLLDTTLPLLLYNSYTLDPAWRRELNANRILVLEPSHFSQFPVAEKVIDFILKLSDNITGIQLFVGEVNDIPLLDKFPAVYSKAHPMARHYPGIQDAVEWIFPEANATGSFSVFWKSYEKTRLRDVRHRSTF